MMREKIHSHMVKMPLCREYFSMLGVINFFSSYFSTLKKHRKIPLLPPVEAEKTGCPSLFPHLPIKTLREAELEFRMKEVFQYVLEKHTANLAEHLAQSCSAKVEPKKELVTAFEEGIRKSILNRIEQVTPRTVADIDKALKEASFEQVVKQLLDKIEFEFKANASGNEQNLKAYASQFLNELKSGRHLDGIAQLGATKYETISIDSAITEEELEDGKKVVGGCGLRMEAQSVQASPAAQQILQAYGPNLISLPPETWMAISKDGDGEPTGSLFRLFFDDLPSLVDEDYSWMASLLHVPTEQDRARIEIVEAMADGNRDEFSRLIQKENVKEMKDSEGRSLLHQAAMLGDPFYLEQLLKKGLAQTDDRQGYLPIHYAAINGAVKQLEVLYDADKKSLNAKSRNGTTPLVSAIQGKEVESVRFILSKKALRQATSDGNNPLHWALQVGDMAIVEELLNGCEEHLLNQYSEELGYPILQACELDSPDLVRKLIYLGANSKVVNKDGKTAIEIAIRKGCIPLLEELLKKAKPTANAFEAAMEEGSLEVLKRLIPLPEFYQHRNKLGETLLHRAIWHGNVAAALMIIEQCSDPGYLQTACIHAVKLGLWNIVEALHQKGVVKGVALDPVSLLRAGYHPVLHQIFDPMQLTPVELEKYLLVASESGNYEAITHILEPKGAQLEKFRGPKGWSLPHYLVRSDGLYLFKNLTLKSQKFFRRLEKEGMKTLAYHAAERGSEGILQFLLEQYKKQNFALDMQYQDRHLLYAIIESGNEKMCQWVLENFIGLADVNLDSSGTRPVHLAAKMGLASILKLLEKHKADLKAVDKNGRTALDLSLRAGAKKAAKFLRSKEIPATERKEEVLLPSAEVLPLHFFASKSATQKISELLDQHPEWVDAEDSKGCTSLFHAIEGYLKLGTPLENVKLLIERGASLRHHSHQLITPLHLACLRGSLSLVQLLVEYGADPNQAGTTGHVTPLDLSVGFGYREISRYLLMHGAKANRPNGKGTTTAHLAVEADDLSFLRLLAAKGIPLNGKDSKGMQPLHYAAAKGKTKTVETLLALGASAIDSPIETQNEKVPNGATALHLAAMSGETETIESLLKQHANPETQSKSERGLLSFAAGGKGSRAIFKQLENCRLTKDSKQLCQAVRSAIAHDNVDLMILLYGDKVPLHTNLMQGDTGLHIACMDGSLQCARWLLEQGADPLQTCATGENALELAAANGSQQLLKLLLEETPRDSNQSNARGETLLHIAAKSGKLGNVTLLLLQGASLSAQDEYGFTPLHVAARNGHANVVSFLLACGADSQAKSQTLLIPLELVQHKGEQTITALKKAAEVGQPATRLHLALKLRNPLAVLALTHLEDCDQPDNNGTTPLHLAVQTGQTQALLYLLHAGATVDAKDNLGHTPLWYATVEKPELTLARLLVQAGADSTSILEQVAQGESPHKADLLKILEKGRAFTQI
ncbi:MAG: ankyrin repeat domain-containing protein, partial [Parachlamydia sp.]|nr:ankyrin repeat domain-containing protein [Parachlamydia sp.]